MVAVKYEDLSEAFNFVSFVVPIEHQAYISLDTGAIYWISDSIEEEELPADLETSDRYIAVPHKNDLDLGRRLALRFVEEALPKRYTTVESIFGHRGAYAKVLPLISNEGLASLHKGHSSRREHGSKLRAAHRRGCTRWRPFWT